MDFKNINIADFVRYILTGFNFIIFIFILPAVFLQPTLIKDLLTDSSFLTVGLLSVAIGYLLDILKIYQLTPKFKSKKTTFMDNIASILEVPREQASSYFSLTSNLSKKYGSYDLERRRSEWVLTLHTAVTLIISILIWGFVFFVQFFQYGFYPQLAIPVLAIVLSFFISIRLFKIANLEREKSDQDFFIILANNKSQILDGWKLKLEDKKELKSADS